MQNILAGNVADHLRSLTQDIGIRLAGSAGEKRAAEYIADHLQSVCNDVRVEEFDMTARAVAEEHLEVCFEYGLIEIVALEMSSYEICAAASEYLPERPKTQIYSRCDVWNGHAVFVQNVREDEVVDMALVVRNEDDWPLTIHLLGF